MITVPRIQEMSDGIDYHLRKLEPFASDLRDVKDTLDRIRQGKEDLILWKLERIERQLTDIREQLVKYGLPEVSQYESEYRAIRDSLTDWPEAVKPESICADEDSKFQRAIAILDLVVGENVTNKRFLDYGCGEGHVIMHASVQSPQIAVGYDPLVKPKFDYPHFYDNFGKIGEHGPYDIVLIHDVCDHLQNLHPVEMLKQLKAVVTGDCRVYLRNHPWSARHGGHLYEQINKAFLHLVFDEMELTRLGGYHSEFSLRIVRPLEIYRQWFKEAGYNILSEIPTTRPVDEFFQKQSYIKDRLLRNWNGDELEMLAAMQVEFVEYCIQPKEVTQQIF
jgi:hypothetical protein